jgi:hypothetical protein
MAGDFGQVDLTACGGGRSSSLNQAVLPEDALLTEMIS